MATGQYPDWRRIGERELGSVSLTRLRLRAPEWRGMRWEHDLEVFRPIEPFRSGLALLYVTGGSPSEGQSLLGLTLCRRIGAPVAVLYQIPNQPLFGSLWEDDLVAHTFERFLETGDESWPVLFPMVESTRGAMSAVEALSAESWRDPVGGFVLTGASKRGWTVYLTAACDPRVRGIAPMVFDNLRFQRQMPRQLELWGGYSQMIDDYTRRGLQQKMDTELGRTLVAMVDPWFHRERLTMPKLLIHGANDPYWATDATRLYWDDLPAPKSLLTIPNTGHGLHDPARLLNSLSAFFAAVAEGEALPELQAAAGPRDEGVTVWAVSSVPALDARLWTATAPGLDFRPSTWHSAPLDAEGRSYTGEVPLPSRGGLALFVEAEYGDPGRSYTLTTPPVVLPAG